MMKRRLGAAIDGRKHGETLRPLRIPPRSLRFKKTFLNAETAEGSQSSQRRSKTEFGRLTSRSADGYTPATDTDLYDYQVLRYGCRVKEVVAAADQLKADLARRYAHWEEVVELNYSRAEIDFGNR